MSPRVYSVKLGCSAWIPERLSWLRGVWCGSRASGVVLGCPGWIEGFWPGSGATGIDGGCT